MSDIFVSYAKEDLQRIQPLLRALEATGWTVFWDRTIPVGKTWRQVIGMEIDQCRCMVVVWSEHSLDSDWVQEEADEGKRRGVLAPVLIDELLPPIGFRSIQAVKLGDWDGQAANAEFDRLMTDLEKMLGPTPVKVKQQQAKQEAKSKAEEQARIKAEADAKQEAEAEARRKAKEQARLKAEEEVKQMAEEQARIKAEAEAKLEAEAEARRKAEEQARQKAEEEAKRMADEQDKRKAEEENKLKAEPETLKTEIQDKTKADKPFQHKQGKQLPTDFKFILGFVVSVIVFALIMIVVDQGEENSGLHTKKEISTIHRKEPVSKITAGQQALIDQWLVQGKEAEQALRLTTPEHDNAVLFYRRVIAEDAHNREAQAGMNRVFQQYIDWVERALTKQRFDKMEEYLSRARSVDPQRPELNVLESEMQAIIVASSKNHYPAGKVFRDRLKDGSEGPEMVVIPAGDFRMGDIQGVGYEDELPVHTVRIARPFALGRYEVTFAEYLQFARATGRSVPRDQGWGRGRRPVINVSWHDAVAYAEWLSEQTGQHYWLPSEAEWEYAARANNDSVYWWGNDMKSGMANCDGCDERWGGWQTAPASSFSENPFGLFDMHGNVSEWTQDCWHDNYHNAPFDSRAWEQQAGGDCNSRVLRGGSWNNGPLNARSANRSLYTPDGRNHSVGFRLARTL